MTDHEVLFIPGPVEVDEELRAIMARPLIGHRNPHFVTEVQLVCDQLQIVFQTDTAASGSTVLFENAPATAVMEAGIRNLVPRGGRVMHLSCGAFSERWPLISTACGREPGVLQVDWGQPVRPEQVREILNVDTSFDAVCITHSETSTGVLNPLAELATIVHELAPDALVLVDAVSSLGGVELQFDEWGIDLAFAGTQKCLALPPGLVVYALSDRAIERAGTVDERGYLLDFVRAKKGFADGKTPATPCVPLVFALSYQLVRIEAETMRSRWDRHLAMQSCTLAWAAANGLEPFVPEGFRAPTVTTLRAPGRDVMELAARAKDAGFAMDKGYGKLKGEAFRIGHMGDHTVARLQRLLAAIA
jgi:aspartate aminotransferase-like enzyme